MLDVNTAAPDFKLHATPDQKFSLSELRGKNVILTFYPADWSPVCGDQMSLYNEMLHYFGKYNAEILGISVDGKWCHAAFREARKLHLHCLQISNPRVRYQKFTVFIMKKRAKVKERFLCSMLKESFAGIIFHP